MAERLPVGLRLYRRLTKAATPLAPLVLSHRLRKGKEDPDRMSERRGESIVARPRGPLVWAHGASIGEMLAILPLVERIRAQGFEVLVTSGTLTSARLMERRLPPGVIHQFIPLDAPVFITRFFDHWRPNLALIAESELWPNLIVNASERRIPMILVNGRLSTRSFTRWRYARESISALLSRFDLCLAQSAGDAERYAELGALRVETTGNLKLDVEAPPADAQKLVSLRAATGNRPLFAAASTHPGEETIIAEMHGHLKRMLPGLLTILVPRHPQRGAAIADTVKLAGLNPGLRSQGAMPDIYTDIYIMDTIGELGIVYRLAPIVFLGGSLVPHGGQNPIEAAKLDCAILHGPNVWNFGEIYEALNQAGGAQLVADPKRLVACVGALLGDNAERRKTAASAQKTVDRLGGAMARTLSVLEPYLLQLRLETRQ